MERAEYREDGIWQVVPDRPPGIGIGSDRRWMTKIPAPRPRFLGWSIVFVGVSNVGLIIVALVVGMSPIGLAACAALATSSWLLVVAELLSLRRLYETRDRSELRSERWP